MLTRLYFKMRQSSKWMSVPLGQENYLIGPNGSGKSTVLRHIYQVSNPLITSDVSDDYEHEIRQSTKSGDGFEMISQFRFDLTGHNQIQHDTARNLLMLIAGRMGFVFRGDELTLMQPEFAQRAISRQAPPDNRKFLREVIGSDRRSTSTPNQYPGLRWLAPLYSMRQIGIKSELSDESIEEKINSLFLISGGYLSGRDNSNVGPNPWVAGIEIPLGAIQDFVEDRNLLETRTKNLKSVEALGSHIFEEFFYNQSGGGEGVPVYIEGSTCFLPLAAGEWENASQSLMGWLNVGQMIPLLLDEPKSSAEIEFEILQAVMVTADRIEATLTKGRGLNPRYQGIAKTFANTQARWLRNVYGEGMTSLRIRPEVEAAVDLLNSLISEILPAFLSDIRVRVHIPDLTSTNRFNQQLLQLEEAPMNGTQGVQPLSFRDLSSGYRTWLCYILLIASRAIRHAEIDNGNDLQVDPESDSDILPSEISQHWIGKLSISPNLSSLVLLLDEPELHLHPTAVNEIVQWLSKHSPKFGQICAATHSLDIFNSGNDDATRLFMSVAPREAIYEPMAKRFPNATSDQLEVLERNRLDPVYPRKAFSVKAVEGRAYNLAATEGREIGQRPGDIFMQSKGILFVEGQHDQIVIQELFGKTLAQAAIKVLPIRGSNNELALFTLDILGILEIPWYLLLDKPAKGYRAPEALEKSWRLGGENAIGRKQLKKHDIVEYFSLTSIRELVDAGRRPKFDDLGATQTTDLFSRFLSQHEGARTNLQSEFKNWLASEFGIFFNERNLRRLSIHLSTGSSADIFELENVIQEIVTMFQSYWSKPRL